MLQKRFPPVKMLEEAKSTSKGRHLILEILIFVAVFFVTQAFVSIPVSVATVIAVFTSPEFLAAIEEITATGEADPEAIAVLVTELTNALPDWVMLVQLFATVLATGGTILYCRFLEKRPISSLGLRRGHFLREYGIGAGIGILLISAPVGICLLTGSLRLEAVSFSPVLWVLFLVGFLLQGMSEEVICRGFMMVSISRRNAVWVAVLVNAVTFALLHLGNPGVGPLPLCNIALFGVLESVYVLKRGDLWGACAIHSLWNFFQGNVFGVSVSGTGAGPSPLTSTLVEGRDWLTGGAFGLEGGLVVTLVLVVATLLIVFFLPSNKDELVDPRPADGEAD